MSSVINLGRRFMILTVFVFGALTANGQLAISSVDVSELTFTNAVPGGHYRVEYFVDNRSPWILWTNFQATSTSITVATPVLNGNLVVLRAVWEDAPPAEALGTWTYEAYDDQNVNRVSGTIQFNSVGPLTAQMDTANTGPSGGHITGEHSLTGELSGNQVHLSRQDYNFFMRGQMVGNEFYGFWSRFSPGITFPTPTPSKWESGTFRAARATASAAP